MAWFDFISNIGLRKGVISLFYCKNSRSNYNCQSETVPAIDSIGFFIVKTFLTSVTALVRSGRFVHILCFFTLIGVITLPASAAETDLNTLAKLRGQELINHINRKLAGHENYEVTIVRQRKDGFRTDRYVRQGHLYLNSFQEKGRPANTTVVDLSQTPPVEYRKDKIRKSGLRVETYNQMALGSLPKFASKNGKEEVRREAGKLVIKYTYQNGGAKEYIIDPVSMIAVRENSMNKDGEITFSNIRTGVSMQPNHPQT